MRSVLGPSAPPQPPGKVLQLLSAACRSYAKRARVARLPRLLPVAAASTDFYAEDGISFTDLGVGEVVAEALHRQSFTRPSRVQVRGAVQYLYCMACLQSVHAPLSPCKHAPAIIRAHSGAAGGGSSGM